VYCCPPHPVPSSGADIRMLVLHDVSCVAIQSQLPGTQPKTDTNARQADINCQCITQHPPLATAAATAHHHYTSITTQQTKPRAADGCQLGRLACPIYCSQNNHCQCMCSASPSSQRSCQRLAYYCGLEGASQQRPRVNWCIPAPAASCCYICCCNACCSSTCYPVRQYTRATHISASTRMQTGTCAGATWNHHPHIDLHQQQQHIG
jgi:hypothetical protein